jgi:hypothetical protein
VANELIGVVTAAPAGPLVVGLGNTLDIVGSFTLNGPSGATVLSQDMAWEKIAPGAPLTWATQSTVVNDTNYTKSFDPQALGLAAGTYTIRVSVTQILDTPAINTTDSNEITVKVQPWKEETAASATFHGGAIHPDGVD